MFCEVDPQYADKVIHYYKNERQDIIKSLRKCLRTALHYEKSEEIKQKIEQVLQLSDDELWYFIDKLNLPIYFYHYRHGKRIVFAYGKFVDVIAKLLEEEGEHSKLNPLIEALQYPLRHEPVVTYVQRKNYWKIKEEFVDLIKKLLELDFVEYLLIGDYNDPEDPTFEEVHIYVKVKGKEKGSIEDNEKIAEFMWNSKYEEIDTIVHVTCTLTPSFYSKLFKVNKDLTVESVYDFKFVIPGKDEVIAKYIPKSDILKLTVNDNKIRVDFREGWIEFEPEDFEEAKCKIKSAMEGKLTESSIRINCKWLEYGDYNDQSTS